MFGKDKLAFSLTHNFYRMFTWIGYKFGTDLRMVDYRILNVQGDASVASLNMTEFRADFKIWKKLFGTVLFTNYLRSSHYKFFPDVKSSSNSLELMLSYKF